MFFIIMLNVIIFLACCVMTEIIKPSRVYSSEEFADMMSPDSYYQIENWCDSLSASTFKTEVFNLSYEEAKAMCSVHEAITLLLQIELQELNSPQLYINAEWMNGARMAPHTLHKYLTDFEKEHLQNLEQKLDSIIDKMGGSAFIRLSTRSPKDAALRTTKMRNIIRDIIMSETNTDNLSEEEKHIRNINAFTIACQRSLKVESGKEALDLLIQSKRATHDISLQRLHLGEDNFSMNIVAREWNDIPTIWEFRCIVSHNEITVITHYYEVCYVPEIVEREDEIISRIRAKFEELNKMIPIDDYTIDFCVDPNSDKIWLIEVNNPPPIAGVSFMDYENEEDRNIIENGPFCFKMNRVPLENPYSGVEPILVRYMKYLRGDISKIEHIGVHPGYSCTSCNMSPIYGERFCCIECGGAEYDMDSPSMVKIGDIHDEKACNLCCFCYCERTHDPEHHYIIFIDDNLICESKLNTPIPCNPVTEKDHPVSNSEAPAQQDGWCGLI